MPEVSQATLAEMERLLKTGPIVIGENHTLGVARQAIIHLIQQKAVTFLSLESPIAPENISKADGEIKDDQATNSYLGDVKTMSNSQVSFDDLVKTARARGVRVYFHDVPLRSSPLNSRGETDPARKEAGPFTTYPDYAKRFLTDTGMKSLPIKDGTAAHLCRHRNHYTANYLKEKLGNGIRILQGLIVLAGADHLIPGSSGSESTLQACLGIETRRAFICV